jgi:predicted oxidoreductase
MDDQSVQLREALTSVANELGGATLDQVGLAWLLTHPAKIMSILGTQKIDRTQSAITSLSFANASEALQLFREQWFAIWSASTGEEVP